MFLKAMDCQPEVVSKAMMNLSLVYVTRGNSLAEGGALEAAMRAALDAAKYMDQGKLMLDHLASTGNADHQINRFIEQYRPLRMQAHRLIGQLYAGSGDMEKCETEFRKATESFPDEVSAWKMLGRVLQVQGKTEDFKGVAAKVAEVSQKSSATME